MLSTQHALCNEDNDSMLLAETAAFTLSLMVYRSGLLRAYDSNNLPNPTASDRRGSHEPGEGILRHTQTAKQDVLQKPFFRGVWPDRPRKQNCPHTTMQTQSAGHQEFVFGDNFPCCPHSTPCAMKTTTACCFWKLLPANCPPKQTQQKL